MLNISGSTARTAPASWARRSRTSALARLASTSRGSEAIWIAAAVIFTSGCHSSMGGLARSSSNATSLYSEIGRSVGQVHQESREIGGRRLAVQKPKKPLIPVLRGIGADCPWALTASARL